MNKANEVELKFDAKYAEELFFLNLKQVLIFKQSYSSHIKEQTIWYLCSKKKTTNRTVINSFSSLQNQFIHHSKLQQKRRFMRLTKIYLNNYCWFEFKK